MVRSQLLWQIHVAIFRFKSGDNVVNYNFYDKDDIKYFDLEKFNLLGGYKII